MRRFSCWALLAPASSMVCPGPMEPWPQCRSPWWFRPADWGGGLRVCAGGWGAASVPPALDCSCPPAPPDVPVVGGHPHSLSGGFWTAGCPAELGQGLLLSIPLLLLASWWERRLSLRVTHPCLCPGSRPDVRGPHAAELACPIPSWSAGLTPLVLTLWGGGFCPSHF